MRCLRRVQRLEARLNTAVYRDPLEAARKEAFNCIAHSDRKVISELAREYHFGDTVEETPEIRQALGRWGDLTALLASQPQGAACGWL